MASRRKNVRRRKTQRLYKMKGCNRKTRTKRKRYLGGSSDANLAYPSDKVPTVPNPHLASNADLARTHPHPGPAANGFNFLNSLGHKGGAGNNGIPYPNGLVGSSWSSSPSSWPGVDGISGDSNHYPHNTFAHGDPQLAMKATGAQPPFLGGGNKKRTKRAKKQKGGSLSNFLTQDLINLGRQFQNGLGTAYNGISGYSAPVSPLPWKDQMPNSPSFASLKAMM